MEHGALIQQLLNGATASENCAASCLHEKDVHQWHIALKQTGILQVFAF